MTAAPGPAAAARPVPRRLRTDVFLMLATKVLTLVLGVVTSVILARGLGASDRGTLAVAFSLTLLLVQLGTFGIATASPYEVARDPASTGRVAVNAVWAAVVLGVLLAAFGAAMRALFPGVAEGVTATEAMVAFAIIPWALGAVFLQSILLGEGRTLAYNGIEAATGVLGAVALAVALFSLDVGVLGVLCVLGIQQIVAVACYVVALRRARWAALRVPTSLSCGAWWVTGFASTSRPSPGSS